MNEITNDRFRKIAGVIQAKIKTASLSTAKPASAYVYRWQHTLRVTQYGRQLAELEGGNPELCITACLLHDIAKFESRDYGVEHGRIGANIARPLLRELGYSPVEIENICFSIAKHVDNKAGFEHPLTIEAQIVNDADKIDRFSAYRFVLQMAEGLSSYDLLIANTEKILLRFKHDRDQNLMATASGAAIFKKQMDLQIMLMERVIFEGKITSQPEL
jgi:uncharacterized protein